MYMYMYIHVHSANVYALQCLRNIIMHVNAVYLYHLLSSTIVFGIHNIQYTDATPLYIYICEAVTEDCGSTSNSTDDSFAKSTSPGGLQSSNNSCPTGFPHGWQGIAFFLQNLLIFLRYMYIHYYVHTHVYMYICMSHGKQV